MASDELLWGFFSRDENAVAAAVRAIAERSAGAVTSTETLVPVTGEDALRYARGGIFSQAIFESDERWGHVDVPGVLHPVVCEGLFQPEGGIGCALGVDHEELRSIVIGEAALRPRPEGGFDVVPRGELEDLKGPSGIAEALRQTSPDHPLLPLCTITKIPVPPPGSRPFAPRTQRTQVDPWIGPTNEAWVDLVERATRHHRLLELAAPDIIIQHEDAATQRAFLAVLDATKRTRRGLLPPLALVPEDLDAREASALAFVSDDRLILQRRDAVLLLDRDGAERARLPPCGARLRGVVQGRYAVFDGCFDATHPFTNENTYDGALYDGTGEWQELSIVDCALGRYLSRVPADVSLRLFRNDQPEELFLEDLTVASRRRIRTHGDRPDVLAYAPGMEHAWVGLGTDESAIVDAQAGTPYAYVAEAPAFDELPMLRLTDEGAGDADADEDAWCMPAVAFSPSDGAWHFLGPDGVLRDHRGRSATRLVPVPELAAFDPSGTVLLVKAGSRFRRIDVARRCVMDADA